MWPKAIIDAQVRDGSDMNERVSACLIRDAGEGATHMHKTLRAALPVLGLLLGGAGLVRGQVLTPEARTVDGVVGYLFLRHSLTGAQPVVAVCEGVKLGPSSDAISSQVAVAVRQISVDQRCTDNTFFRNASTDAPRIQIRQVYLSRDTVRVEALVQVGQPGDHRERYRNAIYPLPGITELSIFEFRQHP
jgi:hypothetical protein